MNLPLPLVQLRVNHREATGDFSPFLLSLTVIDHMDGEADGLEVTLEDTDGRWIRGWYPVKGSILEAWIGYEGSPLLACGAFEADEVEVGGPPDTVTVRAVGNATRKALRTPVTRGYDGASLRQVAQEVASRQGLELVGTVPDVRWRRVTQHQETDLAFLQRLASEHGLVFSVKGGRLVFHEIQALEAGAALLKLTRSDVSSFRFRDKVVAAAASSRYFRGDTKALELVEETLPEHRGDTRKSTRRTESRAHTQRLARAALRVSKSLEREGSLTLPGDPRLVAGGNVELEGWGVLDGLWLIKSATHKVDRSSGYTTDLEVRHVSA